LPANYPPLLTEDVRASPASAAEVLRDETTYPIPA
jgi:hypothetical protein